MNNLIDLTLELKKDNPIFGKSNAKMLSFMNAGHIGTHLDIRQQEEVPLEYMESRGCKVDVSHVSQREIGLDDLGDAVISKGDFVVFYTGFMNRTPYGKPGYFDNHPQLSHDLIDYLIEKKVSFIGIDAAGIRRGREHREADERCAEKGVFVIENLDNLAKVDGARSFSITCLWISREGATGLPCRVVAKQLN